MTLNITVLSIAGIYQSADFRLSASGIADLEPSTKRIIVSYLDWSGFITYTGVGRVGTQHTADVVRGWLVGPDAMTFTDVVEAIRTNGSRWLRRVGVQPHTFIVAAFVNDRPRAAIVSNYQRWHGAHLQAVAEELLVSLVVPRSSSEVIVTGVHDAITRQERRALCRLVDAHPDEPLRIRQELLRLNKVASGRQPHVISEDCVVYSQDQQGRGQETISGDSPVRNLGVMSGVDLTEVIRPFLDTEFGPGQWAMKGAAFARTAKQTEPPKECALDLVSQSNTGFGVLRLAEANGRRATPRAMSVGGSVVGEAAPEWGGPEYPCVWPNQAELRFLEHLGGLGGQALSVNEHSVVVGQTETPDRSSHACLWSNGRLNDLHPGGGRSSGARAICGKGHVVGWLAVDPTEHGQLHFRPTIWSSAGVVIVLSDLDGGWGEAIDVNDELLVAGFAYKGRDCGAWVWREGRLAHLGAPPSPTRSYIPSKLLTAGGVIGTQINTDGSRHIGTWSPTTGWSTIQLPYKSDPTAFDDQGRAAGRRIVDGYNLPWVLSNGEFHDLPYFRHHHHHATSIAAGGWITGQASTDNCAHPLIWVEQT